jgi:hypothetical protein
MGGKVSFPRTPLSKDKVVIVTGGNTGKLFSHIITYIYGVVNINILFYL